MDKKSLFFMIGVVELRNRGAAIILKEDEVALIKRVKGNRTYYVFPGGGIETGETPEQATIREAYEELDVHIRIEHLLGKVEWNGIQYFFLSKIIGEHSVQEKVKSTQLEMCLTEHMNLYGFTSVSSIQ